MSGIKRRSLDIQFHVRFDEYWNLLLLAVIGFTTGDGSAEEVCDCHAVAIALIRALAA